MSLSMTHLYVVCRHLIWSNLTVSRPSHLSAFYPYRHYYHPRNNMSNNLSFKMANYTVCYASLWEIISQFETILLNFNCIPCPEAYPIIGQGQIRTALLPPLEDFLRGPQPIDPQLTPLLLTLAVLTINQHLQSSSDQCSSVKMWSLQ